MQSGAHELPVVTAGTLAEVLPKQVEGMGPC